MLGCVRAEGLPLPSRTRTSPDTAYTPLMVGVQAVESVPGGVVVGLALWLKSVALASGLGKVARGASESVRREEVEAAGRPE